MATEFISNSWLMPENSNQDKLANYSLSFDGTDSISCGNISQLNSASNFSINLWIKYETSLAFKIIFDKSDASGNNVIRLYNWGASGILYLWIKNSGTGSVSYVNNFSSLVNLNEWNLLSIVYDGNESSNNDRAKIYLNGNSSNIITNFGTIPTSTGDITDSFTLAKISNSSGNQFTGKQTEVSIFDYALSSSQVTQLYGTGSAVGNPMAITNGRKPVAYYPLGNSAFNGEFLASNGAEQDYIFDFDGIDDIIEAPRLNLTSAICVSFWMKTTATGVQWIVNEDRTSGTNRNWAILLASNKLNFLVYHTDGTNTQFIRSTASEVQDGNWHNVIFTWDGTTTANAFKTFIDGGNEESTTATSSGIRNLSTFGLAIGSVQQNAGFRFDGQLSNVAIFNTSLPATGTESVESLYNYGTPPNIASYSGLQGWYELDASATFDGSNWSIPDASSNSNTGTSSGMTVANLVQSDLIINAPFDSFSLSFDGVDDFISVYDGTAGGGPSSLKFTSTDSFSISCWINMVSTSSQENIISFRGTPLIWLYRDGTTIGFRLRGNGSGTESVITKTTTNGAWHNIVAIRDYNSGTPQLKLYIDNVSATPVTDNTSGDFDTYDKFSICNDNHSGGRFWYDGKISNLSIYNSALTSAQVTTLYNEHKPFDLNTFAVTPVSWWRLGSVNSSFDGTNWTVLDEIGTNNGTSANMTQADLVDGVGATANGVSSGMSSGTNKTGDAPYSNSNAVSYNMSVTAKTTSVPT